MNNHVTEIIIRNVVLYVIYVNQFNREAMLEISAKNAHQSFDITHFGHHKLAILASDVFRSDSTVTFC